MPIPGGRIQQAPGIPNGIPQVARQSPNVPHAIPNGVPVAGMNGLPVNLQRHAAQGQIQTRPMTAEQVQFRLMQAKAAQLQVQQGYPQGQLGAVAQMQAGFQVVQNAAVKAMLLQQAQQAQQAALGGQKMPSAPNGQAGSPRMQQQPLNQQPQQGGPGELNPHRTPHVPMQLTAVETTGWGQVLTAAEMTALVQHQHPHLPQDQVAKATAQHLANYHQQLSQNMTRQNQGPNGQSAASSPVLQTQTSQQLLQRVQQAQQAQAQARAQANTGPMMSVNGPVGPGANVVSRSGTPQQQQQRSGSAQSPRSVQQSPRLGQAMLVGQQQQQGQGQ